MAFDTLSYKNSAGVVTTSAGGTISASDLDASPTDVIVIGGSATSNVVIRVKSIRLDGLATTGVNVPVFLQKHSTANSGGTAGTAAAKVPLDSTDAAAAASVTWYTGNPTVGTALTMGVKSLCCAAATLQPGVVEWNFLSEAEHGVVLRGTAEQLALNLAGSGFTQTGFVGNWQIVWSEETE
jgi:hypothetical protein